MFDAVIKIDINPKEIAGDFQRQIDASNGAQEWLDRQVVREATPYVPMKTGMLSSSPYRATRFGSGRIVYDEPYAAPQYYGANFKFSRDLHPKATHHWIDKYKSVGLDSLGTRLALYLGGTWRKNG